MAGGEENAEDLAIWDSEDLNEALLAYHNQLRAEHDSPPLIADEQTRKWARLAVADSAKQDKLVTHHVRREDGQNLFRYRPFKKSDDEAFAKSVAAHAVERWYAEIDNWDFERVMAKEIQKDVPAQTKHFTQIVWRETKLFGCAVARSHSGAYYVACNYHPAGNHHHGFKSNVLPAESSQDAHEASGVDAALSQQADKRGNGRRRGSAELRSAFKLGGELEVFDDSTQAWCRAIVVQMGGGRVVAEYTPSGAQEPLRRQITIGDSQIRASAQESVANESQPRNKRAKAKGKSCSGRRSHGNAQRHREESGTEMIAEKCAESRARMREEAGINESRRHIEETEALRLKAKDIFREWDVDHNGSISKQELVFVFQDLGMPLGMCGTLFAQLDTNADGQIDFEEFLVWILA